MKGAPSARDSTTPRRASALDVLVWPVRAVRRELRSIRYHSARSHRSRWTRVMDWALLASPFVALGLAFMTHAVPRGTSLTVLLVGRIGTTSAGDVVAWPIERPPESVLSMTPIGDFSISTVSREHGLPFAGMFVDAPPTLDAFRSASATRTVKPTAISGAVDAFIDRELPPDVRDRYRQAKSQRTFSLAGVTANFAVWWIVVILLTWLVVQGLRVITSIGGAAGRTRRERRRRAGRCIKCGYDLQGIPWSERCPECGTVLEG